MHEECHNLGRFNDCLARNASDFGNCIGTTFAIGMQLRLTSTWIGRRHIVYVGDATRALRQTCFELLCELVVAGKLTESGYLHRDKCCTTAGSCEYFSKLADRLREELGGDSFLMTGPKSYRLPFRSEDISVCRGVIEILELNPQVREKLHQLYPR